MKIELIETKDGSHSLLVPELNETYHSTHGAVTESQYVFIEKGLNYILEKKPKKINILEVGFGTGLNALLTCLESTQFGIGVHYTTLETYPLPEEITDKLNFSQYIDHPKASEFLREIHAASWGSSSAVAEHFILQKENQSIQEFSKEAGTYNLVYFDAFAPSRQPEMWDISIFQKLNLLLADNGVLVTYCAQGQFKRDLKSCGFEVEKLPGPPGKAEMTRAVKR